jgi:hypothetical protein
MVIFVALGEGDTPMRRSGLTLFLFFLCYFYPLHAETDIGRLTANCDRTTAYPYDKNRPKGVAGVPIKKIDPKKAIPACEAAVAVALFPVSTLETN